MRATAIHKIDQKLSAAVTVAARERRGDGWNAMRRATNEMAFIWVSLQPPDVQREVFADENVPFDTLTDVRHYLYGELFADETGFTPYRLLERYGDHALETAEVQARAEAMETGISLEIEP